MAVSGYIWGLWFRYINLWYPRMGSLHWQLSSLVYKFSISYRSCFGLSTIHTCLGQMSGSFDCLFLYPSAFSPHPWGQASNGPQWSTLVCTSFSCEHQSQLPQGGAAPFHSGAQLCPTLCHPMNRSTPGLPVHHQLPESTQTPVHWVGDAIQPSHPLSSPSPPAPNPSQYQGLFQWVSSSHQVAKVLEFQLQHQSFQWTPSTDLLQDSLVESPCSPGDSQESSLTPQFKSINFSALSFLHSPTLTSIHDHWKNNSLY